MRAFSKTIQIAKENNYSIKFIIETHSETIINYLGKLIEKQELSDQDINVCIFEKEKCNTSVKTTNYDKDGILLDWPIGFFGDDE